MKQLYSKKKKIRKKKMMPRQGLKNKGRLPAWSGGGGEEGTVGQQEETTGRVCLAQGVEPPADECCRTVRRRRRTPLRMTSDPGRSTCHGKKLQFSILGKEKPLKSFRQSDADLKHL